jgi:hypothetical protein
MMGLLSKNSAGGVPSFSDFDGGFQQGIKATNSLINSGERGYDRNRKIQARDAIGKAWASGDPGQLDAVMGAFPEYIKDMQKQMGVRDDQHRKNLGSMTARLHGLLNAGDTEGAKALVHQNANLFDKEGPYSAQGVADMIDSGDQKKLKRLDNWAQSTTMGTLTPLEIIKEGDAQQRFGLDAQRMAQNYDLGQKRVGLGYDRLSHQDRWREQAHEDRLAGISSRSSARDQAERRLELQDERQIHSEVNDAIKGPKAKLNNMELASKSLAKMKEYKKKGDLAGVASAYNEYRTYTARGMLGGTATLKPADLEETTGMPAIGSNTANKMKIAIKGVPTETWLAAQQHLVEDNKSNERNTMKEQGKSYYDNLVSQGYTPDHAKKLVSRAMLGTGLGAQDWSSSRGTSGAGNDHSTLWGG